VSVTEVPAQTEDAEAAMTTSGDEVTVMVLDAVPEQFPSLEPVTLYVVVELGVTVILAAVAPVPH
jgi:hypothetical protein